MENEDDSSVMVELYIYDLSKGIAAKMSRTVIGRHVEGIWHTGIVAYGREYYFGPYGIQTARPGGTVLGEPDKVESLGVTYLSYSIFLEYINGLGTFKFAPGTYNLFKHNCNCFTEEVSNFLAGKGIPKYILDLPEEILQLPIGPGLKTLIETLSSSPSASALFTVGTTFLSTRNQREVSPEYELLNEAIEEARLNSIALEERRNELNEKLAKEDRKKKKKKKKEKKHKSSGETQIPETNNISDTNSTGPSNCSEMAESEAAPQISEAQLLSFEETPESLPAEPPIVFKDLVDVKAEYDTLNSLVTEKLNDDEKECMDKLRQYVLEDEGSWALGDNFLNFVGRILEDETIPSNARVKLFNILSVAALKDDVILLLHQDRREHIIMNYAYDFDLHPAEEQLALTQFLTNLFENLSSSEWLLYISLWQHKNQSISNIRVTTKVAIHALLSSSIDLQARGSAIIHNLACKEKMHKMKNLRQLLPKGSISKVFDDVAAELTMALCQYFNGTPEEEQLFVCMKSLARLTQVSCHYVPMIIKMVGLKPTKFRGTSERVDEQIDLVNKRLT
ncbi:uncharacterized protein LOC144473887 isoform X1 [Augochlora pura]